MIGTRNIHGGVYAITPSDLCGAALIGKVEAVLRGGAKMLQYRGKHNASLEDARAVTVLCREFGAIAIVNDDPALAHAAGAEGVHLGLDDPDVAAARALLGPGRLIGVSCYDRLQRALDAASAGADLVAFGSFFPSPTKPNAVRPALTLLTEARRALRLPIVAIGGITPDNGRAVIDHGADWIAVSSGLFGAKAPQDATRAYLELFES